MTKKMKPWKGEMGRGQRKPVRGDAGPCLGAFGGKKGNQVIEWRFLDPHNEAL